MVMILLLLVLAAQGACLWLLCRGAKRERAVQKPPDEKLVARMIDEWLNGGRDE